MILTTICAGEDRAVTGLGCLVQIETRRLPGDHCGGLGLVLEKSRKGGGRGTADEGHTTRAHHHFCVPSWGCTMFAFLWRFARPGRSYRALFEMAWSREAQGPLRN